MKSEKGQQWGGTDLGGGVNHYLRSAACCHSTRGVAQKCVSRNHEGVETQGPFNFLSFQFLSFIWLGFFKEDVPG